MELLAGSRGMWVSLTRLSRVTCRVCDVTSAMRCVLCGVGVWCVVCAAVIELFEHIRVKNVKELIKYMVDKYRTLYEKLDYVQTYKELIIKYDQNEQYDKVHTYTHTLSLPYTHT